VQKTTVTSELENYQLYNQEIQVSQVWILKDFFDFHTAFYKETNDEDEC